MLKSFLIKLMVLLEKDSNTGFSYEYCEIFKKYLFSRTPILEEFQI